MISTITNISPQTDGRAYIREQHTDQYGDVHTVEYLAAAGTDYEAVMLARVPQIEENLKQQELDKWLSVVRDGEAIPVDSCLYVSRDEALVYCVRSLAFDPDPKALWKAAWMMPYFTDDELTAMGFTPQQIIDIRDRCMKLDSAKQLLESVTPIGGV